ncbi:MAG TPA: hypothetical protein PK723_00550 [Candidatus Pacearchaeota archaeon]|jgi:hypothetical protein|nr:hypothetical protein [Candidatus Pacearchaeota archaeon]HPZ74305.1 hypothetical protein [Candidatus Pacearchaeota archaeon]HQD89266.1 hypothetical protein [Candidatus Pacearchaeota archaeon]
MQKKRKIIFAIFIVALGVGLRIFINEKINIPNFEAVTALSLLAGSFLGGIFGAIIPLLIVFFSDLYFGNTSVYIFTWVAYALIGIFGALLKRSSKYYFLKITGMGILSVVFFYLFTNFGWWLTFEMYPLTLQGLIECYIAGLPFLKNQLFSSLIFVPAFALIFSLVENRELVAEGKRLKLEIRK